MVEGIDVAGIFPSGFTLDYGSFDEVSVGTAVHGAEWPAPGVQMQFISKSGGNRYRGTLYADYERNDWQSFNIDESQITRGAQGGDGLSPREANRLWSYHDINADVGGYITPDKLWWYSSFREQDVSARQVDFPVKPRRTHLTNYTAKGTYQMTPNNKFVMFGQAGQNHQPNLVSGFTRRHDGRGQSGGRIDGGAAHVGLDLERRVELRHQRDGCFSKFVLDSSRANRNEKPNGTSPRFEDVITSVVQGGNRDWQENRRSNQVLWSASYFKDGWLGNHHLKVGGETFRTTLTDIWRKGYPGDVLHVLRNGNPAEVYLFQTPSMSENGLWTYAGYASDVWRLNSRLTLSPWIAIRSVSRVLSRADSPSGPLQPNAAAVPRRGQRDPTGTCSPPGLARSTI